jgi:protein TonB
MNKALSLIPALASDDAKPAVAWAHEAANENVAPLAEPVGALSQTWPANPRRRGMLIAVGALHLLAGWLLVKSMVLPTPATKHEAVQVELIKLPEPPPPRVQPPQAPPVALPLVAPAPLITPPVVNIANPIVVMVAENNPPKAEPVAAAPAALAAPAGPRQIPASAVHYIVEPQLHVPKISRRLGESGTVVVHVAVDTHGQIRNTTVRKSSGFDRLDQQALQDIRSARFSPYLENGQPIEWEFDATLQYEVRERN